MNKCSHHAKVKIVEYPQQAYLLIQSKCRAKQKGIKSLSSSKHQSNSLYKSKLANPQKVCSRHRNRRAQQQYQKQNCQQSPNPPSKARKTGFQYSFREMQNNMKCALKCNYSKQLQQENMSLRRQNKCLQEYIKILQQKYLIKNGNKISDSVDYSTRISSMLYQQSRNQMMPSNGSQESNYQGFLKNSSKKGFCLDTKYTE